MTPIFFRTPADFRSWLEQHHSGAEAVLVGFFKKGTGLGLLRGNPTAREFFENQPASYRKAVSWWIMTAKQEKTRLARLAKLVASSADAERLTQFTSRKPAG